MKVINEQELDNGGAIITFEMNEKERDLFIEVGVLKALSDTLKRFEEKQEKIFKLKDE